MIKSAIHTYVPVLNRRDFIIASAGTFATLAMNGVPQSAQAAETIVPPLLP